MKHALLHFLLFIQGIFLSYALIGQNSGTSSSSLFDYLTQEDGAKIQLEVSLSALLQNRKKADYLTATLTDGYGKSFDLEVRTRGKFRRRRCEIPPLKLKFSKSGLAALQLDTMNEIKLVLPCAGKEADEELIVREYLVYRMFESLSPERCSRARLIRLQIKDSAKKRPQKMLAMLVEHEEQVSGRLRSAVVQDWGVPLEKLDADQVALAVLFQYMVGNTDWEINSCRNIMLLQPEGDGKIITIPYDFDFSGIVAAPYASPNSECSIRHVRDRCLMASGIDPEALRRARGTILKSKSTLYEHCRSKFLAVEATNDMTLFLDSFFDAMDKTTEIPERLEFSNK